MELQNHEIEEVIHELTPFYYQYQMLESILEKTEKELMDMRQLKQQLYTYFVLLRDTLPYVTCSTQKTKIELYLRKLIRCI